MKRVVVALGGNALLRRGEPMTHENQRANVAVACAHLAPNATHELVVSHGNGPQIGLLGWKEPPSRLFLPTSSTCSVPRLRA